MDLGFLFTISCVLTIVSMTFFVGIILFFVRYGGQGVKMLFDRFLGGDKDDKQKQDDTARTPGQQPAIASSRSIRQRAQQLDFPGPGQAVTAGAGFGAQAAQSLDFPQAQSQYQPQQASLTPRGQFPDLNQQANQLGQSQNFQLSTPSLSPSRPFQAGSQFDPNPVRQQPGQQQFGQQSMPPLGQQAGQQPLQSNQLGQPGLQSNRLGQPGQQSMPPLGQQPGQQQFGQQSAPPLGQQPGFNAQGLNPPQGNPQQGPLGQNRPPLRSVPRPGNTQYDRPIGRRDSRRSDDRDHIYDEHGGGNFLDDIGNMLDNV